MKKAIRCSLIIFMLTAMLLSGCSREDAPTVTPFAATPSPAASPQQPEASPSPTANSSPSPSASPSDKPTPSPLPSVKHSLSPAPSLSHKPILSPLPADVKIGEKFFADINNDGAAEALEIINDEGADPEDDFDDVIKLSVSGASRFYKIDVDHGYCETAFFARTPNGAVCLFVNVSNPVDSDTDATVVSFNGIEPILRKGFHGEVYEVSGTKIAVRAYLDVFGSWDYHRFLKLRNDFTLAPETEYLIDIDVDFREPLHTIRELPVQMLVGGVYQKQELGKDTYIYPVSTDGDTYVDFTLKDGSKGRIYYTREDYEYYIDGVKEGEYFDNINYWE